MMDDNLAFGDRLVAFLPNMRRFALSLCRSAHIADDLVQSACERALQASSSFKPGTRFDAWIFRIIRNLWIDRVRREKTAGPTEDITTRDDISIPSGEAQSEARFALKSVAEAIARLPDEQREVLMLVCVEDLAYREAADVLSIPIGTVMSRLARARKALAEMTGINPAAERLSDMKGARS